MEVRDIGKPFSFVHLADSHLGYMQYGLEARRRDFSRAFEEAVDETLKLKPDFMIIAGDIFENPRPGNPTLAEAVSALKKLRDHDIRVFAIDGSHDSAPNVMTGTALAPLDKAGLLYYLPFHEGSSWSDERVYIYGIPYSAVSKGREGVLSFMEENKPSPDKKKFNILVFHAAVDDPRIRTYFPKPDLLVEDVPDGFNYYGGGHVHAACNIPFKSGILAYSGCLETNVYEEAEMDKGFYYVTVSEEKEAEIERVRLKTTREFIVLRCYFTGKTSDKIAEESMSIVERADKPEAILVLVLEGYLPKEARRGSIALSTIRTAAKKALHLHIVNKLEETTVSEEIKRMIFRMDKDLMTKAYDYFFEIFAERYGREEAKKYAKMALDLLDPLVQKRDEKVKEMLEKIL